MCFAGWFKIDLSSQVGICLPRMLPRVAHRNILSETANHFDKLFKSTMHLCTDFSAVYKSSFVWFYGYRCTDGWIGLNCDTKNEEAASTFNLDSSP